VNDGKKIGWELRGGNPFGTEAASGCVENRHAGKLKDPEDSEVSFAVGNNRTVVEIELRCCCMVWSGGVGSIVEDWHAMCNGGTHGNNKNWLCVLVYSTPTESKQ